MRAPIASLASAGFAGIIALFGNWQGEGIYGRVSSVEGKPLPGVFVSARNSQTGKTIHVLSQSRGTFAITGLEPGKYDVKVDDRAWTGEERQAQLGKQGAATLDLIVSQNRPKPSQLTSSELLPLLPEGEGKTLLLSNCMSCHTLQKLVTRTWDRSGWRQVVGYMQKGFGANVPNGRDNELVDYLAAAFSPDSSLQKSIRQMTFPSAPARAVTYSSWDVPIKNALPHTVTLDGSGNAFFTDPLGSHIGRLELATGKFKIWDTPTANSYPHGIVTDNGGNVWFTERLQFEPANKIVKFDPRSEAFKEYPMPKNVSGPHTPVFDRRGVLWISEYEGNRIAAFDPQTEKFTEYEVPTKNARPYGVDVDKDGVIWVAEIGSGSLGKLDPRTGKVVDFSTPTRDSGVRRVRIDSTGRVWFTEFLGDRLGMFDPKTEKMTEYLMPGVRPQPYALEIARNDQIWLSTWNQDSMIKFDPQKKTFTIYPVPFLDLEIRDFRIDKDDTLWFMGMVPKKLISMQAR